MRRVNAELVRRGQLVRELGAALKAVRGSMRDSKGAASATVSGSRATSSGSGAAGGVVVAEMPARGRGEGSDGFRSVKPGRKHAKVAARVRGM